MALVEEVVKEMPTKKEETSFALTELDGVGSTGSSKLRSKGIMDIRDLAVRTAPDVKAILGCDADRTVKYILDAISYMRDAGELQKEAITGREAHELRKNVQKFDSGSQMLNTLLQGGFECEALTELLGAFGSGKTQICHTAAVLATRPIEEGGLGGSVLWIDTEGTIRTDRMEQIAKSRGLNFDEILDNKLIVIKSYSSAHLESIVEMLQKFIEEHNIKLVIVDSIMAQHRAEFPGMGMLADRQQRLSAVVSHLKRVAEQYKIAVLITNQVQDTPGVMFGNPQKPAGGNVIGHASTYRIQLDKSGKNRKVTMMDSPNHKFESVIVTVNEKGIDDDEETLETFLKEREKAANKKKEKEEEVESE